MAEKTFTAPLAIIKIGGVAVGRIKDLQFTENVQRGEVQGIGEVNLQEIPILSTRCTFTASSFLIDLKKFGTIKDPFWPMEATNFQEMANSFLLNEKPVTLSIHRKTAGTINEAGIVTSQGEPERVAVIPNCYLDSKTFSLTDGQIAGKNISGRYLEPINLT
jgi:hypothetical protein